MEKSVVISGSGLFTPKHTITNVELVESYNAYADHMNALHHAEILAINAALAKTGMSRLDGYDLWVTLEPCAMCAGAIAHARLKRVYFAAYDVKAGAVESGIRYFDQPSCHHRPEIYGGLSEQAASNMLTEFFAAKR